MTWKCSLKDLASATGGSILQESETSFSGVATDGRFDNKGKIFFALKGENFDAHDYLDQAVKSGAKCLVIHRKPEGLDLKQLDISIVEVQSTLKALGDFGLWWRRNLTGFIVGVTGTNGKTTTKEFAATICGERFNTFYSRGSFNNHIGVPLTLLSMDDSTQIGICEMGMNHPGELEHLAKITEPSVVVVTTVGRGHLEGMGSVQAVADAKEELYKFASATATRIYNLDNTYTKAMLARAPKGCKVITFSSSDNRADVVLKENVCTLDYLEVAGRIGGEPGQARVPVFGRQNVNNLMAAASIALACGAAPDRIWKSLPNCKTVWGRNQILKLESGARALFDGYNANPDSMAALIENFSRISLKGKKIAVLGQMLEMGKFSPDLHQELGARAGGAGFDVIWFVGHDRAAFQDGVQSSGFKKNLMISESYDVKLATEIQTMLQPGDVVLIKGSRGMKLERVAQALKPLDFKGY